MENFKESIKAEELSNATIVTSSSLNNDTLKDFTARKTVIEQIIADITGKQQLVVNINLKDVNVETTKLERFVIELIPRLREIGASLAITNNSILQETFITEIGL